MRSAASPWLILSSVRSVKSNLDRTQEGLQILACLDRILQVLDVDGLALDERTDARSPECDHMAAAAERPAHVAGQSPHARALAARGPRTRPYPRPARRSAAALGSPTQPRIEHDLLAVAREIVGPLTIDLDRRERRRHLP